MSKGAPQAKGGYGWLGPVVAVSLLSSLSRISRCDDPPARAAPAPPPAVKQSSVWMVNGLDLRITFELDGERIPAEPRGAPIQRVIPAGTHSLRALVDGAEIRPAWQVSGVTDGTTVVFNPLGAAPVYLDAWQYRALPGGSPTERVKPSAPPRPLAGEEISRLPRVDVAFAHAPPVAQGAASRTIVALRLADAGWPRAVDALELAGRPADALKLLRAIRGVEPRDPRLLPMEWRLVRAAQGAQAALDLARAAARNGAPGGAAVLRAALRAAGRLGEAAAVAGEAGPVDELDGLPAALRRLARDCARLGPDRVPLPSASAPSLPDWSAAWLRSACGLPFDRAATAATVPPLAPVLVAQELAASRPAEALDALRAAPPAALARLAPTIRLLLGGEALRLDHPLAEPLLLAGAEAVPLDAARGALAGRPAPGLAPAERAALTLARARRLRAELQLGEADALDARLRADPASEGPVRAALDRWPAPAISIGPDTPMVVLRRVSPQAGKGR